jgi:hypothetical protein
MTVIKARLEGHPFDLETLAELFREGDPAVDSDAAGYYLGFDATEGAIHDGVRWHEDSSRLLRRVNGVGQVRSTEFRPVRLTGL